jgi:hypothetical protein
MRSFHVALPIALVAALYSGVALAQPNRPHRKIKVPFIPPGLPPPTGALAKACQPLTQPSASTPANASGASLQPPDVVPGVASKLLPPGSNVASGAVQAGSSGTQFRVLVTPLYLLPNYVEFLSEMRIGAATDTSTNLTSFTLGFSWNPFAVNGAAGLDLQGARGEEHDLKEQQCGAADATVEMAILVACGRTDPASIDTDEKRIETQLSSLRSDLRGDIGGTLADLISGRKTLLQKQSAVTGAEGTARDKLDTATDARAALYITTRAVQTAEDELRNATKAVETAEDELRNATKPVERQRAEDELRSAKKTQQKVKDNLARAERQKQDASGALPQAQQAAQDANKTLTQAKKEEQDANDDLAEKVQRVGSGTVYNNCVKRANLAFWPTLFKRGVARFDLTGEVDVFPAGVGPNPLDKTGATTAPLQPFGGVRSEASVTFRPDERFELGFDLTLRYIRPTGAPYTQLAPYEGGAAYFTLLVWSPLLPWTPTTSADDERAKNADYLKSGFLPGLKVGLSGQALFCQGVVNCAVGQTQRESLTPFVDYAQSAAIQFRFSLPIIWSQAVTTGMGTTAVSSAPFSVTPTFSAASAFIGL